MGGFGTALKGMGKSVKRSKGSDNEVRQKGNKDRDMGRLFTSLTPRGMEGDAGRVRYGNMEWEEVACYKGGRILHRGVEGKEGRIKEWRKWFVWERKKY